MAASSPPGVARALLACALTAALTASAAHAGLVHEATGFTSNGTPVSFAAGFTIADDTLTVVLRNDSAQTPHPSDLLCTFYFDIVNAQGARPTLTYVSAHGDVWRTDKNAPDTLIAPATDLRAISPGDNTWQYRAFTPAVTPFAGFGVGTVGNSNIDPNNFNGNIVGGRDYGLYAGDIASSNLHNTLLVKSSITFVFTGVSGFTEADIARIATFGLGTGPDMLLNTTTTSVTPIPAPASGVLSALACGILLRRRRR